MDVTNKDFERPWGHSLSWGNPHSDPPAGMPRTIGEVIDGNKTLTDLTRSEILAQWPQPSELEYGLGCGYSWHLLLPINKRKEWSAETKAKARVKRQTTLVKKAYPLFADEFIERGFD